VTLKVIVDGNDRILAVAHVPVAQPGAPPPLTARPLLGPGMREFDVIVPAEHIGRKPREHLRALHVTRTGVSYRG
jgi:hypothetical protein